MAPLGLVGGFLGGFLGSFEPLFLDTKIGPNRGIWLALRNAFLIGLLVVLAMSVGLGGLFVVLYGLGQGSGPEGNETLLIGRWLMFSLVTYPRFVWLWTAGVAFWVGLWAGGMDFVKAYTLRLLLALWTPVPARYTCFLDHATDRGLLRRNGGTYAFYHGLLQDYFVAHEGER